MERAIAKFIGFFFFFAFFFLLPVGLSYRLIPQYSAKRRIFWLLIWAVQGLFLPIVLWAVMNYGISWSLQPFMPEVQVAQNSGEPWFPQYLRVIGRGIFIVSSDWAALTLGWVIAWAAADLREEQARSDFKALSITCSIAMLLPGIGIYYLGGLPVLGLALMGMAVPIAAYAPNIVQTKKLPPMYGRAIAKLKFGKYTEAEWEIIREL